MFHNFVKKVRLDDRVNKSLYKGREVTQLPTTYMNYSIQPLITCNRYSENCTQISNIYKYHKDVEHGVLAAITKSSCKDLENHNGTLLMQQNTIIQLQT